MKDVENNGVPLLPLKASLKELVLSRLSERSRLRKLLPFNPLSCWFLAEAAAAAASEATPAIEAAEGGRGGSGRPRPALSRRGRDPVGAILL